MRQSGCEGGWEECEGEWGIKSVKEERTGSARPDRRGREGEEGG